MICADTPSTPMALSNSWDAITLAASPGVVDRLTVIAFWSPSPIDVTKSTSLSASLTAELNSKEGLSPDTVSPDPVLNEFVYMTPGRFQYRNRVDYIGLQR